MGLESFTADLFSGSSKEMKEVVQLITRLMNLVIGALDRVEQELKSLDGRISSAESSMATAAAVPALSPSPALTPAGPPDAGPAGPFGPPGVGPPGPAGPPDAGPPGSPGPGAPMGGGLGIRAALQSELKDAFKRLRSSMDTEE